MFPIPTKASQVNRCDLLQRLQTLFLDRDEGGGWTRKWGLLRSILSLAMTIKTLLDANNLLLRVEHEVKDDLGFSFQLDKKLARF